MQNVYNGRSAKRHLKRGMLNGAVNPDTPDSVTFLLNARGDYVLLNHWQSKETALREDCKLIYIDIDNESYILQGLSLRRVHAEFQR